MVVWFETFYKEITSLSAEKNEAQSSLNSDPRGHDILYKTHHLIHTNQCHATAQ